MIRFAERWMIIAACLWTAACGSHPKDKKRLEPRGASSTSGEEGDTDPSSRGRGNSNKDEPNLYDDRGDGDASQSDLRLDGSWVTECIDPAEGSAHHTKIEHRFVNGIVQSTASLYSGSCLPTNLQIRLTLESHFVAGRASALGQDVRLIDYRLRKAFMSLHSEGELLQSNLQNGARGRCLVHWEDGQEIEISALTDEQRSHCGGKVRAPKEGTTFFDIYQLKGDELRFGTAIDRRPSDGEGESPNRRPQELANYVYRKMVD